MLRFEREGAIAVFTLDRPEARNAIDGPMARAIEDGIDRLEADDSLMVGIISHTGTVFSAGADLKAVRRGEGAAIRTERGGFAGIERRIRTKPLIAAVEGRALGGGFEIALACDLVVASTDAVFGLPEVSHSLLADRGRRHPAHLGDPAADRAGDDPHRGDDRRHPSGRSRAGEPAGRARRGARRGAAWPSRSGATRHSRCARRGASLEAATHGDEDRLRDLADREWEVIHASEDFVEGPRAFAEKRPPRWQGR